VAEEQVVSQETWALVNALLARPNLAATAEVGFRRAFPDAPPGMIEAAVFHVFRDGIGAALEWVAATERFLRDPSQGIDHGATCHVVYHLYNWQQFEAVLPIGRAGVLERLQDMRLFLAEGDNAAAEGVCKQLAELFGGDVAPPGVG